MKLTEKQILEKAITTYGVKNQLHMLAEECAEFIVALNHLERGRIAPEKMLEEMVDINILLKQLFPVFHTDDVNRIEFEKLERLETRLEGK